MMSTVCWVVRQMNSLIQYYSRIVDNELFINWNLTFFIHFQSVRSLPIFFVTNCFTNRVHVLEPEPLWQILRLTPSAFFFLRGNITWWLKCPPLRNNNLKYASNRVACDSISYPELHWCPRECFRISSVFTSCSTVSLRTRVVHRAF